MYDLDNDKFTLQTITILSLFANNIENGIDQLRALSIMTLGPIVARTGLAEDEVIRAKDLAVGARSDAVHGARFEIHEHGPWDVSSAGSFIEVDVDPLELEIGRSSSVGPVFAVRFNAVLVADHFPELGADLIAALASLDVQDLSHCLVFGLFAVVGLGADGDG